MFDFFRKGMGSMLAGGLLAILIASFALWGIGDPLATLGSGEVAEVGDEKVTSNELRVAFENEFRTLQQQAGDSITRELAIQIGVGAQAVSNLVQRKAYDVETANLGLRTSDGELRDYIYSIPVFQDETGTFNRSYFDNFTRSQGYSTKEFENILRTEIARGKLLDSLISNVDTPEIIATTLSKFASEKRTAEILSIPASAMTGIGEVNDENLKAYFDENSILYMAPEYRDISYFEFSANDVAETISISDEDARATYDVRLPEFTKQEERSFVQMLLDDQETADLAYADLEGGKSFDDVIVEKTGDTVEDGAFESQPRDEFVDLYGEEAATALFNADLNGYTAPIETGFGVYIFKITDITPGSSESFEDVKDTIVTDLKMDQAIDLLFDMRNKVDDELAAGSSIDGIANVVGVPLKKVSNVSIEGLKPDGSASSDLPLIVDFLNVSFQNEIGSELELYEGISNKFYMVNVDNTVPAALREFEDVKERVNADWAQSRRETVASEFALRIVEEYNAAENAEKALSDYQEQANNLTVNEVTVGRGNQNNDVSSDIHTSIFSQEIGSIEMINAANNDGYVLIRVKGREFPENTEETALNDTKDQIKSSYQNDLLGAFVMHLYEALPVEINNDNVRSTLEFIATPVE